MTSPDLRSLALGFLASSVTCVAELRVPAFTAYLDPVKGGASVSERSGVSRWKDPAQKVLWFGHIESAGKLSCSVTVNLPAGGESKLRLNVAGQLRDGTATGDAAGPVTVSFG